MTAALCMSVLGPYEDDPPNYRLRAMPNDQDDDPREATPTDAAPPLSERDAERITLPPDPVVEAKLTATMLPAAPRSLEDSYLDKAIRVVAEAGADIRLDREERRLQHAAVLEAIRRSDENQTRNYELLRDEVRHLKESDRHQDRRLAEGDERFAQIENSIEALKSELLAAVKVANDDAARRIAVLERELGTLKANAARTTAPTSPEQA